MSENNLKELIKKALINFDIKNEKYKNIIKSKEYNYKLEYSILEFTNLIFQEFLIILKKYGFVVEQMSSLAGDSISNSAPHVFTDNPGF